MPRLSAFGRKRLIISGFIIFASLVNLGLSVHVNEFQEYFYAADKFPLAMSIITMVSYVTVIGIDFAIDDSFVSRPPFILGHELSLSIFWLAANAFSTSRWRHVPLQCDRIPSSFSAEKSWCRDLQALKSFVWIEWLMILLSYVYIVQFVVREARRGRPQVWRTALSRYDASFDDSAHASIVFIQYSSDAFYTQKSEMAIATVRNKDSEAARQYRNAAPAGPLGFAEHDVQPQGWVGFGGAQVRNSVASGPGMAGVGTRPVQEDNYTSFMAI